MEVLFDASIQSAIRATMGAPMIQMGINELMVYSGSESIGSVAMQLVATSPVGWQPACLPHGERPERGFGTRPLFRHCVVLEYPLTGAWVAVPQ